VEFFDKKSTSMKKTDMIYLLLRDYIYLPEGLLRNKGSTTNVYTRF